MKIAATLLLVPVVALAQAPGSGMDRSKMLEQMKQSMLPMIEQSLPEMDKTRQCVQASGNTAELKKCAEIMQEFQQRMMTAMTPPPGAGGPPGEGIPEPMHRHHRHRMSNGARKKRDEIVQGLKMSIKQASAMAACLKSSATPEQMDSCMQQSGLSPKRPQ